MFIINIGNAPIVVAITSSISGLPFLDILSYTSFNIPIITVIHNDTKGVNSSDAKKHMIDPYTK
jgi:hypothetical protein